MISPWRRALPLRGASISYRSTLRSGRRYLAEQSRPPPPPAAGKASTISRIEARLPRFLGRYIAPLRSAPVSHITAFLVLHEITAIVPVFGLAYAFHYLNWLPPILGEGKWVKTGTEKFGNYLRKKGWIEEESRGGRWFGRGETGVSLVVCLGAAYAVTKALLPLRIVLSVWATPWFARWTVLPVTNRISRLFSRSSKAAGTATKSSAAGTGAVGGGAIPKDIK